MMAMVFCIFGHTYCKELPARTTHVYQNYCKYEDINACANSIRSYQIPQNVVAPDRINTPHYENTPIQIYRKFHLQKLKNFQIKNSDIFHISAQNIDCGYSLEPTIYVLSRNKKNKVYPCKPQFYFIKVGFKGVKII